MLSPPFSHLNLRHPKNKNEIQIQNSTTAYPKMLWNKNQILQTAFYSTPQFKIHLSVLLCLFQQSLESCYFQSENSFDTVLPLLSHGTMYTITHSYLPYSCLWWPLFTWYSPNFFHCTWKYGTLNCSIWIWYLLIFMRFDNYTHTLQSVSFRSRSLRFPIDTRHRGSKNGECHHNFGNSLSHSSEMHYHVLLKLR